MAQAAAPATPTPTPTPEAPPKVAKKVMKGIPARPFPMHVQVEKDKAYMWCTCGSSKTQPWCDGRHKGTDFRPLKWVAPATAKVNICMCKQTNGAPICDMSHLPILKRMYGPKVAGLVASGVFAGAFAYFLIPPPKKAEE